MVSVSIPLLFLFISELLLRVIGFGYPTSYWLPWRSGSRVDYVDNARFGYRFFPHSLARRPLPNRVSAKPENSYRILIFGESAAMGDPEPAFSFGRILEILLDRRYPGFDFEVINTAFTAINSHAILPIARDSVKLEGDVWILYAGHNEVAGPFGPGTVFGTRDLSLNLIRANLALKTTRFGQWLEAMSEKIRSQPETPEAWGGLSMFLEQQISQNDPRLDSVRSTLARNLSDIIKTSLDSGAQILLMAPASNLKDCPPFASKDPGHLPAESRAAWNQAMQDAQALQEAGIFDQAIPMLLEAEKLEPSSAELQFRLGSCFLSMGDTMEAKKRFEQARDLDRLRFRTDSTLRELMKSLASESPGQAVRVLDAEALLADAADHGIPGHDLFFDHVHLKFEGNYWLARALAGELAGALKGLPEKTGSEAWASPEECARQLGLTSWHRVQMLESMITRLGEAPFTNQWNHATRIERLKKEAAEFRAQLAQDSSEFIIQMYQEAIEARPEDPFLQDNLAKFLQASGRTTEAIPPLRRVAELLPHQSAAFYGLGLVLNQAGQPAEAESQFRQALRLNPAFAEAANGLGAALGAQGKWKDAQSSVEHALKLRPAYWEAHLNLGQIKQREGRFDNALLSFQKALELNPAAFAVHLNLGNLRVAQGDWLSAVSHFSEAAQRDPAAVLSQFEQAVGANPEDEGARLKLANALAVVNQREKALQHLEEAVRLKPAFWEARYLLAVELVAFGKLPEAEEQFRQVIRLKPSFAKAHLNLGVALAQRSQWAEAEIHFRQAVQFDPANQQALQYLKQVQALKNQK